MKKSNFHLVMDAIRKIAEKGANGQYFVKRGAIEWESHSWASFPKALSIQCDERDFLKQENRAELAIEFATELPKGGDKPGIDDGVMDEFAALAEFIVNSLEESSNPDSKDPIGNFAFGVFPGKLTEFHDVDFGVQGLIARFSIAF